MDKQYAGFRGILVLSKPTVPGVYEKLELDKHMGNGIYYEKFYSDVTITQKMIDEGTVPEAYYTVTPIRPLDEEIIIFEKREITIPGIYIFKFFDFSIKNYNYALIKITQKMIDEGTVNYNGIYSTTWTSIPKI